MTSSLNPAKDAPTQEPQNLAAEGVTPAQDSSESLEAPAETRPFRSQAHDALPIWERRQQKKKSLKLPKLDFSRFDPRNIDRKALAGKFGEAAVRGAIVSGLKMTVSGIALGAGATALGAASFALLIGAAGTAAVTLTWDSFKEYKARKATDPSAKFTDVISDWSSDSFKAFKLAKEENADLTYKAYLESQNRKTNGILGAFNVAVWSKLNSRVQRATAAATLGGLGGALIGGLMQLDPGFGADAPVSAPVVATPEPVVPPVNDVVVTVPAEVSAPATVAAAVDAVAPAAVETVAVSSADVAADPLAAGLAAAGLDADASGQALKDAAHALLRDGDIAGADRIAMAQALAQQAVELGNTQAADFLLDLPVAAELLGVELPAAAAPVEILTAAPPVEILTETPVTTVVPLTLPTIELAPVEILPVEELTLDPVTPLEPIAPMAPIDIVPQVSDIREVAPVSAAFEAAVCQVSADGTTDCQIISEQMAPGSRVAFVSTENPSLRVTTTLGQDSVAVSTRSFLGAPIVEDGVNRLRSVMAGIFRIG